MMHRDSFEPPDDDQEHVCTAGEGEPCETCEAMGLCGTCGSASPWRCCCNNGQKETPCTA